MKPALRRLLVCALLLVAGSGAQAQGDEVLERYGLALVNLSESVRLLATDVPASRDELDRAAGALRFLATQAGSPSLVEAMERVFEHARTAISNRSNTDLAVQAALIRGGFQRAVFESALGVFESEPAVAQSRLERLATDLGLSEEARTRLSEAGAVPQVRRVFEAVVADGVRVKLQQAEASYAESRDAAYRRLADAYGDFLLIQDSPRADADFNTGFGRAASSLVENRSEEMSAALASLRESFQQLTVTATAQPDESASAGVTAGPAEPAVVEQPAPTEETAAAATGEAASESRLADMPSVLGQAQANQSTPTVPALPQGTAGEQPAPAAADLAAEQQEATATGEEGAAGETAEEEVAPVDAELQALRVDLIASGVPAARAAELAAQLNGRGVTTLSEALDDLYGQAGRVVAAVQAGDAGQAKSTLTAFESSYERELQPALALISPAVDRRTTALVDSLSAVPALRAQDALVLLGQVDAVGDLLEGEPASNVQIANAQATILWAGWPRLATLIALALLAIVPLYLLNLAFGGGNRNWQLIGVALFLLLLPVIYEGLASLAAVIARYSGIEVLAVLLSFSMFHNPVAQVVWAAITAVAILFAVAGLYGICVQFGLLGSRRPTTSDSQTIRSTAVVPNADTVVDWDEEF